jgi:hypothetical protein
MESAHSYRYVGPAVLAECARLGSEVITVTSAQVLARWLGDRPADELGEPFTFVVGLSTASCGWRRSAASTLTARLGSQYWPPVRCFSRGKGPGGLSARSATNPAGTVRIRIPGRRSPRRWTHRTGAPRQLHARDCLPPLPGLRPAQLTNKATPRLIVPEHGFGPASTTFIDDGAAVDIRQHGCHACWSRYLGLAR